MLAATLTIVLFVASVLSASLQSRQIADFCGFVEAELVIDGEYFGIVELCVCYDLLDSLIETNGVAKKAAAKTSTGQVKDALANILFTTSNAQTCVYPPNTTPVCTQNNPCAWTCDPGFVQRGDTCVNPSSGIFSRRDLNTCNAGLDRCGVWSSWGPRSYECLDTQVELESCGGCVIPYGDEAATGADCSQIKGVSDVECLAGRCVVTGCRPGHVVNIDGTSCTPLHPSSHHRVNVTAAGGQHKIENIFHHPVST